MWFRFHVEHKGNTIRPAARSVRRIRTHPRAPGNDFLNGRSGKLGKLPPPHVAPFPRRVVRHPAPPESAFRGVRGDYLDYLPRNLAPGAPVLSARSMHRLPVKPAMRQPYFTVSSRPAPAKTADFRHFRIR